MKCLIEEYKKHKVNNLSELYYALIKCKYTP